jgi:hypothetical protein
MATTPPVGLENLSQEQAASEAVCRADGLGKVHRIEHSIHVGAYVACGVSVGRAFRKATRLMVGESDPAMWCRRCWAHLLKVVFPAPETGSKPGEPGGPGEPGAGVGERAVVQPVEWVVIPAGVEATRFHDPGSFYLKVRLHRSSRDGDRFVVSPFSNSQVGFTRLGHQVYLRHDVNAKHAFHDTFEQACDLARDLADGVLASGFYQYWRVVDERRFGPFESSA